jgi:LuxR family transcriptional regulator, maltose regulon positive regulatory protein
MPLAHHAEALLQSRPLAAGNVLVPGSGLKGMESHACFVPTSLAHRLAQTIASDSHRFTLLTAPAGFGKTMLLNHLRDCVTGTCGATKPGTAFAQTRSSQIEPSNRGQLRFIDDFDSFPSGLSSDMLDGELVGERATRYVLASRRQADSEWLRRELGGSAAIFTVDDFRLSVAEVRTLLESIASRPVSVEIAEELAARTGGWPVAICLIARLARRNIDWRSAIDTTLAGGGRLTEYLDSAVLGRLSQRMRRFLNAVSCVEEFSVPLCSRLIGNGAEAGQLLNEAISQNLFIWPMAENGSYRLAPVVAHLLDKRHSVAQRAAHLSAAMNWYLETGKIDLAVEYALRLGRRDIARSLLIEHGTNLVCEQSDMVRFISWVDQIQHESAEPDVSLSLWAISARVFLFLLDEAEEKLAILERHPVFAKVAAGDRHLLAHVAQIRCTIALRRTQLRSVREQAGAWLEQHPAKFPFLRTMIEGDLAFASFLQARSTDQRRHLAEARHAMAGTPNECRNIWLATLDLIFELDCGNMNLATKIAEEAVQSARYRLGGNSQVGAALFLVAARVAAENQDYATASAYLARSRKHIGHQGLIETSIAGIEASTWLLEARGDSEAALCEARYLIRHCDHLPRRFLAEGGRVVSLLLLRKDDVKAARLEYDTCVAPYLTVAQQEQAEGVLLRCRIVEAAIMLAENRCEEAYQRCTDLLRQADAAGRARAEIELLVLQAATMHRQQKKNAAIQLLSRAVSRAAACGFVRPFQDLDWALRSLLPSLPSHVEAAFVRRLRQWSGLTNPQSQGSHALSTEALTMREMQILKLLQSGMRNQRLAEYLDVSLSTIKWHLQNIYGKLGADNKANAIYLARNAGLLS